MVSELKAVDVDPFLKEYLEKHHYTYKVEGNKVEVRKNEE